MNRASIPVGASLALCNIAPRIGPVATVRTHSMTLSSRIRGLYGIADDAVGSERSMEAKTRALVEGGACAVQLRMKGRSAGELYDATVVAVAWVAGRALVLVNDRLDVALAAHADGVHLGDEDLPVSLARRIAGPSFLIGRTVRSLEEARASVREGADYVGFGPVYETRTKRMTVAAKGPVLLSEVARGAGAPVVAIGGIDLERAGEVSRAGAAAAAVVSDILCAADPTASARGFVEAFRRAT